MYIINVDKEETDMTIKQLRLCTGLSQNKFAQYMGIPVANIQRWEQGTVNPPEYVVGLIKRVMSMDGYPVEDEQMSEFYIACCETAGLIISDNIKGGKNKYKILQNFKDKYKLNNSPDEIFKIIKNIFHEKLADDKYGINNLK